MKKLNTHYIMMFAVAFDFVLLIAMYLLARYLNGFDMFKWKIREVIVGLTIICILFITLEKFEFTHSYRYIPFLDLFKKTVYFELFLLSIFYVTKGLKIYDFHDKFVARYAVATFIIILAERAFIKLILSFLRSKGYEYKNFLIIGAGDFGLKFYRMCETNNDLGIKIVGFLDDDKNLKKKKDPFYTDKIKSLILGNTGKLKSILKSNIIDNVIIALPMKDADKILNIFKTCDNFGVRAELIPHYADIISENSSVRKIKNFTLIGTHNMPLENMFNRFLKRLIDFSLSLVALIVFSPLILFVMILIKLNSKGPVFFKQKRTGYNQKEFYIYKFRTMKVNVDADKKQATKDDPRKTKLGDFLRKTNIDELPQLINILKGDMSIIGPRPHMLMHTEEFHKKYDKYLVRHWVKPGLTGWAQVNGWRGDSDIGIRVKYDLEYIENWSLLFDLKILFLTFFGKKVKRHAY